MDTIFITKGIDADKLFDAAITWVLGPGLRIILIIVLAWVGARIGSTFIQRSLALALHPAGRNPLADIQITKRLGIEIPFQQNAAWIRRQPSLQDSAAAPQIERSETDPETKILAEEKPLG